MAYQQAQVIRVAGGAALRGVWLDRRDRLYAAVDSECRVYDPAGGELARWPAGKPALSVAVAENGALFVGQEGQIGIFDGGGRSLGAWRDPEKLGKVTSIGFYRDNVLAGDASGRCIRRLDKDGKFLNDIARDGRQKGLLIPNGVVDFGVDSNGVVHAANPGKHRVERYTMSGELLGHIGRFDGIDPEGFPGCCNPTNVAVGKRGQVYVTEKADARAKVLDAEGKLLAVIATGVFDPNCKNMDVAVDSRGRVYVADTVKLQVVVFAPAAEGKP